MEKINKLKKLYSYYNLDGYIVPKNDEYFSEFAQKDKLKAISSINFTALTNALGDGDTNFNDNIIFEDDTITSHKNNILNEIQHDEEDEEEKEAHSDDDFIDVDEI